MKKVGIFVDVQNIYYTTQNTHHCNFNYNAFWAQATQQRQVVQAIAYAVDRGDAKQQQFQNILRAIGFEVKLKPFIQRADGSAKGDWDVGITIDIMEYAADCEVLILVSGDGDFDRLVTKVRQKFHIPVEVYGVKALTANSLISAASSYIPIEGKLLLR